MKRLIFVLIILLALIGCTKPVNPPPNNNGNDENKDVTPPLFLNAQNSELPKIRHKVKEQADLLANITVVDNESKNISLEIIDNGGYDHTKPGTYQIKIEAKDEAGNSTI